MGASAAPSCTITPSFTPSFSILCIQSSFFSFLLIHPLNTFINRDFCSSLRETLTSFEKEPGADASVLILREKFKLFFGVEVLSELFWRMCPRLPVETDPTSVCPVMARLSGVRVFDRDADCAACLGCEGDRAVSEALNCMASVSEPLLRWALFCGETRSGVACS
jgi:hypothetical protein